MAVVSNMVSSKLKSMCTVTTNVWCKPTPVVMIKLPFVWVGSSRSCRLLHTYTWIVQNTLNRLYSLPHALHTKIRACACTRRHNYKNLIKITSDTTSCSTPCLGILPRSLGGQRSHACFLDLLSFFHLQAVNMLKCICKAWLLLMCF